jgi:predicted secreted protein
MKFKKLALITAFGLLSTSVGNAAPVTDEVVITGTITELLNVVVAPNETITMDNVANPITVNVEANVEFKIKVKSDNGLTLDHTTNGVNATVAYTFDLKDGGGNSITAADNTFSGTQDPIDTYSAGTDSWDLEVTTTGVDGSTLAGDYTDTLTLTIQAI